MVTFFCEKVALLEVKELHELSDDLKIKKKELTTGHYPVPKF